MFELKWKVQEVKLNTEKMDLIEMVNCGELGDVREIWRNA